MASKEVPDEISYRLTAWRRRFRIWYSAHFFLGITGMVAGIIAAVTAIEPILLPVHPIISGIIAASFVSVITFLRPSHEAKGYIEAWRKLSAACNRYKYQEDFSFSSLQDAVDEGERIIRESGSF
ncbi:MAG: hypothetical protein Q7R34_10635 [Dehalococcoidia bacterium]|nr:hypothetical protein [Dehalococcoidia bacterium]